MAYSTKLRRGKTYKSTVPTFVYYDVDEVGKKLFDCISQLEYTGLSLSTYMSKSKENDESFTCIDDFFNYIMDLQTSDEYYANPRRLYATVKPDFYKGNNSSIKQILTHPHNFNSTNAYGSSIGNKSTVVLQEEYMRDTKGMGSPNSYLYDKYGLQVDLGELLNLIFVSNDNIPLEQNLCSIDTDFGIEPINCISKILEMENLSNNAGYPMKRLQYKSNTVINALNSGSKCVIPVDNSDKLLKTSCMEVSLIRDMLRSKYAKIRYDPTTFTSNLEMYDLSIPSHNGYPCIQQMFTESVEEFGLHSYDIERYLLSIGTSDYASSGFIETLNRNKYKFENYDYDTTVLDYLLDNDYSKYLLAISGFSDSSLFEQSCIRNGSEISCLSKLITNMSENDYDSEKIDEFSAILINPKYNRGILSNNCFNNTTEPVPCLDNVIELSSKKRGRNYFVDVLNSVLNKTPLSNLLCTLNRNGIKSYTNCLDKLIDLSTSDHIAILSDHGTLLDRKECSDFDGTSILCIDKLFQRHEMWIRNYFRMRELNELSYELSYPRDRLTHESELIGKLTTDFNLDRDPGFLSVSREYDLGNLKCHAPGRVFETFKQSIDTQIEDYNNHADVLHLSQFVLDARKRYLSELSSSVSSKKQREIQIAPRMYKLLDVYETGVTDDYVTIGVTDMNFGKVPISLNMFECKDNKNDTISCLQKNIDVSDKIFKITKDREYQNSVFSSKDIFKPELCIDKNGNKITCFEYAYEKFDKHLQSNSFVNMIMRKDFRNISGVKIIGTDGNETTVGELACGHATLDKISMAIYDARSGSIHSVTNGNPTYDGDALEIMSRCKCSDIKDPMEKRICEDTICYKSYVSGTRGRHNEDPDDDDDDDDEEYGGNSWAYGYIADETGHINQDTVRNEMYPTIFNDSTDYFGLAGVYELTYDPSEYPIQVNTERFNYDSAVESVVFPAIKRLEGRIISRYKNNKNIRIENISLTIPDTGVDDYKISVLFKLVDDPNTTWIEDYSPAQIFLKGGLLNSDDLRMRAIHFKNENNVVERILTMGMRKSAKGANTIKMIISNRPADFLRASSCQNWSSCMNVRSGAYNNALPFYMSTGGYVAYLASDEFSSKWMARSMLLPTMMKTIEDDPDHGGRNIRVNEVYGLSMYKPLLADAIQIVLRNNRYNEPETYRGRDPDADIFGNTKRMKLNIWMNTRKEAFRNCLERVANGETLQIGKFTITENEGEHGCDQLLKTMEGGGVSVSEMYKNKLVSDRSYRRFETMCGEIGNWYTEYIDGGMGANIQISDRRLEQAKQKVSVDRVNNLSILTDEHKVIV